MEKIITVVLLLYGCYCSGQSQINKELSTSLDQYIEDLMDRQGIPGLALAVVKNKQVIHRNNYGYANLEHQVPVSAQSIFRVYSLTKPLVAVALFQLIEKGKLSLEDKIDKYVSDLPEEWRTIQIKHLLSHSGGLPDMSPIPEFMDLTEEEAKKKVFLQDCKFKPGAEYDYNQTGFWLLQKVVEKIEGTSLAASISEHQFETPCDTAFFSSDSRDIVLDRATPYFPFTKGSLTIDHPYLQGNYAHALNGLNISLSAFIKWDQRLRNNELIAEETKELMWETFPYSKSNKTFTYGWDKRVVNEHSSYGFSGSLVTAYRIFPEQDLSIIFLSNGLTKFYNIENVINHIAGMVLEE